jgi:hypothetical protein
VDKDDFVPFILVNSLTQENLDQTHHIEDTLPTHLASASWSQLKHAFITLSGIDDRRTFTVLFQLLDPQSVTDRKVVIIEKGTEWIKTDGKKAESSNDPDATKYTVWRKYRVPFEQAWDVQCAIVGFIAKEIVEEWFVEDVEREFYVEEEVEESSDDTGSDETTSEDLEYGDFPIKAT